MTISYPSDFFESLQSGSLLSARAVLPAVFSLLKPRSVVDVGCGVGPWLKAATELGTQDVVGIDGDYVDVGKLLFDAQRFVTRDLNREGSLRFERRFDLAISMEVAEHLPDTRADSFVRELTLLSDTVLLSAAIPGQGGYHHINEQWPDYWSERLENLDYECYDFIRPAVWNQDDIQWWYAQNTLMFAKRGSAAAAKVGAAHASVSKPESLVHPRNTGTRLRQRVGPRASAWFANKLSRAWFSGKQPK